MIDASRSPRPAWKRYGSAVVLAGLIAATGNLIWAKELHHQPSGGASPTTPAVVTPGHAAKHVSPATSTSSSHPAG